MKKSFSVILICLKNSVCCDGARGVQAAKEEPVANFEFCFAFEAEEPSKHRLQELMWEEMRRYHPEQGPWKGKKSASSAGQLTGSPR